MSATRTALHRGTALTEFAIVLPVLVTIFLFGMFFTELVRAKLKLQEASRFVAWEMTSHSLSDYGKSGSGPNHNNDAYEFAKRQVLTDALKRYEDLDSVDERTNGNGNFVMGYSGAAITMSNLEVPAFDNPLPTSTTNGGGPMVANFLGALNSSSKWLYQRFGFDTRGQVQAELTITLDNRMLPRNFLNGGRGFFTVDQWGGRRLQQIKLRNRFTLIADGWQLSDGADAEMHIGNEPGSPRAGVHRGGSDHGLYRQVARMTHFGVVNDLMGIPGIREIMKVINFAMPNPFASTYVVSHNYGLEPLGTRPGLRGCRADPGHTGSDGLNNLARSSVIDFDPGTSRGTCFDTAPFRDLDSYGGQYVSIFNTRGQYFMGCTQPMSDDPTSPGPALTSRGDHNNKKVDCGYRP